MSTTHIYTCDGCNQPIDRHDQTKVLSTVTGFHFFHAKKTCQQDWQRREDRKKFDIALEIQQRQWFR